MDGRQRFEVGKNASAYGNGCVVHFVRSSDDLSMHTVERYLRPLGVNVGRRSAGVGASCTDMTSTRICHMPPSGMRIIYKPLSLSHIGSSALSWHLTFPSIDITYRNNNVPPCPQNRTSLRLRHWLWLHGHCSILRQATPRRGTSQGATRILSLSTQWLVVIDAPT